MSENGGYQQFHTNETVQAQRVIYHQLAIVNSLGEVFTQQNLQGIAVSLGLSARVQEPRNEKEYLMKQDRRGSK